MRRDNNFDLLRLFLAWIVVFTHCADLSLSPAFLPWHWLLQSDRAVEGFFAISGCLIVASWDRSKSPADYFRRRAKRILPAYWLALGFCLVLGTCLTTIPIATFWRSMATWKYIACNLIFLNFLQPTLPGVFANSPKTASMDGALWTIKIEVAFYFVVPVLVWLIRRYGTALVLTVAFTASLAFRATMFYSHRYGLMTQLPGQLCFFIVGAAVYYYFPVFSSKAPLMWSLALGLTLIAFTTHWMLAEAIGIPLLVLCIGFMLPAYRGVTKHGDFSYGTYVLHYPVVQTLLAFGIFTWSPWLAVCFVIAIVIPLSLGSWFGVERQFLRPARVRQQEHETLAKVA